MASRRSNREILELQEALKQVRSKLDQAQSRLEEANHTLHAIQTGAVDAVVAVDPGTGRTQVLNLRSAEHPYRIFVEAVSEGALTVNRDGVAIFCNRTFTEMMKATPGKILGRSLAEFFPRSERRAVDELLERGRAGPFQQEIALQALDGSRLQILLSASPLQTEDLEGICILATDLSERHRSEAALRRALERARLVEELETALELRDEFLSIASHELRTPITSMILQLQMTERLLKQGGGAGEAPRLARGLGIALRQARRLVALVEDLLDVSQIQSGQLNLHPEEVRLAPLVDETLEQFREECARVGCEVQVPPEISAFWDPVRIQQVLVNLVSNAFKYGEGTKVTISARKEGEAILLRVHDCGRGIPAEERDRIFGLYERAVPSRHISGLGLGLFITRRIVESHGGTIRVESDPEAGTTFEVELPARVDLRGRRDQVA